MATYRGYAHSRPRVLADQSDAVGMWARLGRSDAEIAELMNWPLRKAVWVLSMLAAPPATRLPVVGDAFDLEDTGEL